MKIPSNMSGDGLQNGGMLIVKKEESGPELLLFHTESVPGDHVSNDKILATLSIVDEAAR